jgi:hypothetical protein
MPENKQPQGSDFLSPADLQIWLRQEIADSTKALELRLREAAQLVTDYAQGKITPEEATKRAQAFDARWGEALPGTSTSATTTDAQILSAIDDARQLGLRPRNFQSVVGNEIRPNRNSR